MYKDHVVKISSMKWIKCWLHQRNFTFASWLQCDVGYFEDLKLLAALQFTLICLSDQPKWSVLIFSLRLHQPVMHNDELQVTAKNPVTIVPHRGYYISIFMLKWLNNKAKSIFISSTGMYHLHLSDTHLECLLYVCGMKICSTLHVMVHS